MSSSDSDDETVFRYGTPLEPFDDDEVPTKRKYQDPVDQYAVDEHGRRRFHGAFTGGFSAGYGNTVGTPEGWAPASFKSSRSDKAQTSMQRAEDFMDEEDRSEFGIAPRRLETHSDFSGQKRPHQKQFHDGPIPGEPVLGHLLRPVHETAAVKILKQMGWREGQGAGERLSRADKRRAAQEHRVYGCYAPPELRQNTEQKSDAESSDSEFEYDTLFAPDDYEPYVLANKTDRFGLGYSGLSRHSVLGSLSGEYGGEAGGSHLVMKDKGKKVSIRGQAFGVGAFEADDEDIYAKEDMSHYDFALGGASEKAKSQPAKERGSNILKGFVKAVKPLPPVASYPPPALPRDYVPAAAGARRSRFEPSNQPQRDQGLGRHELSPQARGVLLGETPIPKTMEPPTQAPQNPIQDPIAALLGRNVNCISTIAPNVPKINDPEEPKELNFIPISDSGKELTKLFKPFVSNPSKQARYEMYLRDKDSYMVEQNSNTDRLKQWERDREIVEFEQAAKLYRPLTGAMGDRFTHASEPDEGSVNPLCAVAKSRVGYGLATPEQVDAAARGAHGVMTRRQAAWRPDALVCKRFNVPDPGAPRPDTKTDDRPKVSYSVFSYLESSVHDKDSFAKEQTTFSGSKSIKTDVAPKSIQNKEDIQPFRDKDGDLKDKDIIGDAISRNTVPNPSTSADTGFKKRLTVAELFLKESEEALKNTDQVTAVTETINKFDKMDLYKSIFLSDSEEEDVSKPEEHKEINFDAFLDVPSNVERNLSPPRGIFANIDFDEINSWKRNKNAKPAEGTASKLVEAVRSDVTNSNSITEKTNIEIDDQADVYGPKIPETLKLRLESFESTTSADFRPVFRSKTARDKQSDIVDVDSSSSADSWVDAKEFKSKKQKKKKSKDKKQKSKHKKSKHKKKDR